jgi:hypothetical protein
MNAQTRSPPAAAMLVVTNHYCLHEDPTRTLEALRVFLITGAEPVLDALLARTHAQVATGSREAMGAMAVAMHAQGFSVQLLPQAAALASF